MSLRNHSLIALFYLLPIATTVGLTLDEWQNQFLQNKLPIPQNLRAQYCKAREECESTARLLGLTIRLPKTTTVADNQENLSTNNKSPKDITKQPHSKEKPILEQKISHKTPYLETQKHTTAAASDAAAAVNQQITLDGQWKIINVIGIDRDQVGVIYPDNEDATLINFALHASENNTAAILLLQQLDDSNAEANPTLRLVESTNYDLFIPANTLVAMDVSYRRPFLASSIFNESPLCPFSGPGRTLVCSKNSFIHLSLE
ncbi:MAG: hypothetical protein QS748_12420 [Candidatus Endonucleobacter bathymodioli]|uniref:Uncharacterized protein n=1 Tax=Candidatus Endonucleibacter bathymodioli TaxID=539814 RepID=A0AA90P2J4_9GAMM|nr:hypothetical protein [Candidatus Endonucleobacter bathymodioli]